MGALALILVAGAILRAWGLGFDLPYVYHPDEPVYVEISQTMFKTGDLNPHFFNLPSLFFYVHALAYVPYFLIGRWLGPFTSAGDILSPTVLTMGVVKSPMPTTVLMGRLITLAFGVGCVVLAFLATRKLSGKASAAVLAAAMTAVSPTHVWNNRWITPDTMITFFALSTFLVSVLVFQEGKRWQYGVAGVCVGLTASSKYNGALIVLALVVAHFLREGSSGIRSPDLYLSLVLSGLTFLATTPFAVLDFPAFLEDVRFEAEHYSSGHPGMEGDTLRWYVRYLWESAGLLSLLAMAELAKGAARRSRRTALLAVFPVVYFVFINRFTVRNARTIMPLTPFLFILAASLLGGLFAWAKRLEPRILRHGSLALMGALTTASLALPLKRTVRTNLRLSRSDSREMAREWIGDHLASGAKVAVESYGPYVDPESFSVQGVVRIIDHDLGWYRENDFDYLIFSSGMYGRYYRERGDYEAEVRQYEAFFNQLGLVRVFEADDTEIRIYRMDEEARSQGAQAPKALADDLRMWHGCRLLLCREGFRARERTTL